MLEWCCCRGMSLLSQLFCSPSLYFLSLQLSCFLVASLALSRSFLLHRYNIFFCFDVGYLVSLLSLCQLMVSLLLCLLDWCMAVPLSLLLEPITMPLLEDRTSHKAPLLDYIYRVGSLTDSWEVGKAGSCSYNKHACLLISSETCRVFAGRHNNFSSDTSTPTPPNRLATLIRLTSTVTS